LLAGKESNEKDYHIQRKTKKTHSIPVSGGVNLNWEVPAQLDLRWRRPVLNMVETHAVRTFFFASQ